ncbi:hypothetical protein SPRG_09035 [Saprolegnia parasitica CBS 223.65]|uniref:TRP C-terminal domain-containing protein n=1 Tax=Saprolegnia parasitica (strain CBS 223.65) TaxID=695850 RepID=A0A067CGT3_SAPPC|nr:hypothetical protein SPRG_09035 [Saprolegnia parasitica CBS 223.65]KDO25736.1 hypothetical protein SPRG_09035 [Saprolegnia parasitica CBS 223.65]|eukprot:XP_012203545.1 hypothetical protein SPRG_09035 [Saprolegnia parasitica CBS 223.65]
MDRWLDYGLQGATAAALLLLLLRHMMHALSHRVCRHVNAWELPLFVSFLQLTAGLATLGPPLAHRSSLDGFVWVFLLLPSPSSSSSTSPTVRTGLLGLAARHGYASETVLSSVTVHAACLLAPLLIALVVATALYLWPCGHVNMAVTPTLPERCRAVALRLLGTFFLALHFLLLPMVVVTLSILQGGRRGRRAGQLLIVAAMAAMATCLVLLVAVAVEHIHRRCRSVFRSFHAPYLRDATWFPAIDAITHVLVGASLSLPPDDLVLQLALLGTVHATYLVLVVVIAPFATRSSVRCAIAAKLVQLGCLGLRASMVFAPETAPALHATLLGVLGSVLISTLLWQLEALRRRWCSDDCNSDDRLETSPRLPPAVFTHRAFTPTRGHSIGSYGASPNDLVFLRLMSPPPRRPSMFI